MAPALALLAVLGAPGAFHLADPSGDDDGPGTYRYPVHTDLVPGTFDLTALHLEPDGDEVRVRACFRARPRPVQAVHAAQFVSEDLLPQVIDVYLDTDGVPGSGRADALPGRRVRLRPDFAWEHALVIAARENGLRQWLAANAPEAAARTTVRQSDRPRRGCLAARFPLAAIGGAAPAPGWGVTVLVTGARFNPTFETVRQLAGAPAPDCPYVRPVRPLPGPCDSIDGTDSDCAFGGCDPCGGHPPVIDALVCGSQHEALARHGPADGPEDDAEVTGVRLAAGGAGPCTKPPARAPCYRVADAAGDDVTLVGGPPRQPGDLGDLVDGAGRPVGRIVVTGQAGPVVVTRRVPQGAPGPTAAAAGAAVGATFEGCDAARP